MTAATTGPVMGDFTAMAGRLAGKVVLVTGTSPNIGGVAATGFAAAGAHVACNDIRPEAAGTLRRGDQRSRWFGDCGAG